MGEETGMTNAQYKGMLLDELDNWQEVLELAVASNDTLIQKRFKNRLIKSMRR